MPHATPPLRAMASTRSGMRRILKRSLPIPKYIELAVKAGTYKTPSVRPNYLGLHDNNPSKLDALSPRQRDEQRIKLQRGILDYPPEYEILSMNPPLPFPAKTPVKVRKWIKNEEKKRKVRLMKERKKRILLGLEVEEDDGELKQLPGLDELVKCYLRRYEDRISSGDISASMKEQEYYSQLLLGKKDAASAAAMKENTHMGQKSMLIENAYAFALRQQQVLLQGDVKGMQDSAAKVEELLEMEARSSRKEGTKITKEIQQWREQVGDSAKKDKEEEKSSTDSIPSILHSKPRSIRALSIWTARLQSIPYNQWSLGATTALDHWIAREVLGMDENTWTLILEGGGADVSKLDVLGGGETRGGLAERMRDVVMTREALFPETVWGSAAEDSDEKLASDLEDETNKSINALLASLGSFDDDIDEEFSFNDDKKEEEEAEVEKEREPIEGIMNELQGWREKNEASSYEKWDEATRKEFDQWIDKYVSALSLDSKSADIDMEATRKALLSQPPIDTAKSKDFWNRVRTESEAEVFLQDYRSKAEEKLSSLADSASLTDEEKALQSELQAILEVPYNDQLNKLVNMGSIRPVLDEYTENSDREQFLEKYSSIFLEGLELEYLVPDPNGPITLDDLGPTLRQEYADGPQDQRFIVRKMAYGTDEFDTPRAQRARDMYRMWNEHKANRARFEEAMFKKGYMGLAVEKKTEEEKKEKK